MGVSVSETKADGPVTLLDIAADVFDHDDGVVNDKAGRYGEGHEGQVVEAEAAQVHHAKGPDDGKWHGEGRNNRGTQAAEEKENDQHHERNSEDQGELHIVYGGPNRGRAVG